MARGLGIGAGNLGVYRSGRIQHALIFSSLDGEHLIPEHVTKAFGDAVARARKELPDLPVITLHGLRHTHEQPSAA